MGFLNSGYAHFSPGGNIVMFCFDSSVVKMSGLMLNMVSVRRDGMSRIVDMRCCSSPEVFAFPIASIVFFAEFFGVDILGVSYALINVFTLPVVAFWRWCSGTGGNRCTFCGVWAPLGCIGSCGCWGGCFSTRRYIKRGLSRCVMVKNSLTLSLLPLIAQGRIFSSRAPYPFKQWAPYVFYQASGE